MNAQLTDKGQREVEEMFDLKHEAIRLLGLVVAEWKSDPTSVQCFDLRIVEQAKQVVAKLDRLQRLGPHF